MVNKDINAKPSAFKRRVIKLDCSIIRDRIQNTILQHNNFYSDRWAKESLIKAIVSGKIIELYLYQYPVKLGRKPRSNTKVILDEETKEENAKLYRRKSSIKARNNIRRLVLSNFDEHSKFITLTFEENIIDLDYANREFKKFIQRMRRKYGNFKYLAVIQFQKRGAVHYHLICDLPYIDNEILSDLWGNGFIKINDITRVDNVGAYITHYMSKDNGNLKLIGRKSYFSSKNLDKPTILYREDVRNIINKQDLYVRDPVFFKEFDSEFNGNTIYLEYNLKNLQE